ncbi:7466_t:CDS:2, partial [Funneliformis mosseae]
MLGPYDVEIHTVMSKDWWYKDKSMLGKDRSDTVFPASQTTIACKTS